jgi:hypothetical protein
MYGTQAAVACHSLPGPYALASPGSGLQDQRAELEYRLGTAGNWGHTEPVSPRVIITFVLGFALAFAVGWYFI